MGECQLFGLRADNGVCVQAGTGSTGNRDCFLLFQVEKRAVLCGKERHFNGCAVSGRWCCIASGTRAIPDKYADQNADESMCKGFGTSA